MPVVTFYNEHRSHEVEAGTNLREFMRKVHVTPYKGIALFTNCRGHNFCGTCAVDDRIRMTVEQLRIEAVAPSKLFTTVSTY